MELLNNIYNLDAREALTRMKEESVDLVVCSPPYDNLRDYGKTHDGNKPEWNFQVFEEIAKELTRVLKEGGVIAWNVFDQTVNGSRTGSSFRQALYFMDVCGLNQYGELFLEKNKSVYPGVGRYHQTVEYCFLFSKGKPKALNFIEDIKSKSEGTLQYTKGRKVDGSERVQTPKIQDAYSRRSCVWRYVTGGRNTASDPIAHEHPALMNEQIAKGIIFSWSNKGDVVLDPLAGAGTTLVAAKALGRKYIGFEIIEKHCDLAKRRLEKIESNKDTEEPSIDNAA